MNKEDFSGTVIDLGDKWGVKVYEGMDAPGISIYDQVEKEIHVDIRNNPEYVVYADGVEDDNGISESIYSNNVVYKVYDKKIADPPVPPTPIKVITETEDFKTKVQDMLDKYWGNKKKLKEYRERYIRLKKHVVINDNCLKIEDYKEKLEDEKFLQLQEYSQRLERFSKSSINDFSGYDDAIKQVKLLGIVPKNASGEDLSDSEIRDFIIDEDYKYIMTNNYAYNQHKTTSLNLKTLGKHGEKAPYYKLKTVIEEVQYKSEHEKEKGKKINVRALVSNSIPALMNLGIWVRNYTKAPIYSIIGKGISKVQELLIDAEEYAGGLYKNQRTHRYEARKDVYEQMFDLQYILKCAEKEEKGKKVNTGGFSYFIKYTLAKAFKPRFQAIFQAKEGNVVVEASKAHEIEETAKSSTIIEDRKRQNELFLEGKKNNCNTELNELKNKLKNEKNEDTKYKLLLVIKNLEDKLRQIEENIKLNNQAIVPAVIQTDPISLSQHSKANKENITKVVTGVVTTARVAAMTYLGPKITKFISEKVNKTQYVPSTTYEESIWVDGKPSKKDLENISIGDVYDSSDPDVSYYAGGGREAATPNKIVPRGVAFDSKGINISGTDGVGYNWKMSPAGVPYSTSQIDNIAFDSKLFETIAETISKSTGKKVTAEELIDTVVNSSEPQKTLADMVSNLKVWVSSSPTGVATGWADTTNGLQAILTKALEGHYETISKYIPGKYVTIPSMEWVKRVDPKVLSAMVGVSLGEVVDIYDLLRRTKSSEEMKKDGTYVGPINPNQNENNNPYDKRNSENTYGFTGTKFGDHKLYDESGLGTPGDDEIGRSK